MNTILTLGALSAVMYLAIYFFDTLLINAIGVALVLVFFAMLLMLFVAVHDDYDIFGRRRQ